LAKGKGSKPSLLDRLGLTALFRKRGDDKLINEYEEIVRQNPEDYRARIKLAEFYAKQGNQQRAEEEFLTVAKSYKDDGFNLKAIATYKQVLKLNADNSTIILELADLYKRQGLIRDAIDQYHAAIVIFQQNQQKNEVLHVLKRMSELSHESVELGLKLADLFTAESYVREASDQLLTVAGLLADRGDRERAEAVLDRLLSIHDDTAEALRAVQEIYDEKGAATKASMVGELIHSAAARGDRRELVRRLWGVEASDSAALMTETQEERYAPPSEPTAAHHAEVKRAKPAAPGAPKQTLDDEIENFIQSYSWSGGDQPAPGTPGGEGGEDLFQATEDEPLGGHSVGDVFGYEPPADSRAGAAQPSPASDVWSSSESVEGVEDVLTRALSEDTGADLDSSGEASGSSWIDEGEPPQPAALGDDTEAALLSVDTDADDRIRLKSDRDYLDKMPSQIDPDSLNPNNAEIFTRSGFERVFSEFKKGLEQQIGNEDADTHYNLGIAYKEMALIDDAIHEFEIAAQDPTWRVDALTMMALCHEDNEELEKAISFLKEALETEGVTQEKATGLLYEIGLALEALGRFDEAYDYFSKVYAVDEDYRNVKKKLADLLKEL